MVYIMIEVMEKDESNTHRTVNENELENSSLNTPVIEDDHEEFKKSFRLISIDLEGLLDLDCGDAFSTES